MPLYSVNAIVLRRISFSETDRIVTLYSRELGKISGIAKGARKPISRLAGATETLTHGRFQLATGKNLDVITQAEAKDSFPRIKEDMRKVACGIYVAELVERFVEEREPNVPLFELLLSTLYLLERPNDPEKITHMFELRFMSLMGYQPRLDKCVRCGADLPGDQVYFSPSLGGVICAHCGHLPEDATRTSLTTVHTMEALLTAQPPEVEKMQISTNVMEEISRMMRWYIRFRAPSEIKSMNFLHIASE